jgi:hypothetical protein
MSILLALVAQSSDDPGFWHTRIKVKRANYSRPEKRFDAALLSVLDRIDPLTRNKDDGLASVFAALGQKGKGRGAMAALSCRGIPGQSGTFIPPVPPVLVHAAAPPDGGLPPALRREAVLPYDHTRYDFASFVIDALQRAGGCSGACREQPSCHQPEPASGAAGLASEEEGVLPPQVEPWRVLSRLHCDTPEGRAMSEAAKGGGGGSVPSARRDAFTKRFRTYLAATAAEGSVGVAEVLQSRLRDEEPRCSGRLKQGGKAEGEGAVTNGDRFKAMWRCFISDVIYPEVMQHVRDTMPQCQEGMYYQAIPTFRCHMPGTGRPLTLKHTDASYHHQPTECNIWLPVTPVAGNNSLFVESAPGRADFHALEALPGQYVRFWGNQVEHFTEANDTHTTRVSFDVRVVPACLFDHYFVSEQGSSAPQDHYHFLPPPPEACTRT